MLRTQTLSSLKLNVLRTLTSSIGSRINGTKAVLLEQLQHDVRISKLPTLDNRTKTTRVLSIDMGIKNLAFCVCDIALGGETTIQSSRAATSTQQTSGLSRLPPELSVIAWNRIAVTTPSDISAEKVRESHGERPEAENPFSPRELSQTAYTLVKNLLLPYSPNTILIERQRFRSLGGSAILEWTVRVNMLEAMLWAVLATLRSEKSFKDGAAAFPAVWDVSPRKVNTFWVGDVEQFETESEKKVARSKVEKQQKIELVQRWILSDHPDAGNPIKLSFKEDAVTTKDAFVAPKRGKASKAASKGATEKATKALKLPTLAIAASPDSPTPTTIEKQAPTAIGKLDDLADCLLQAATWAKWEQNRRTILPMMESQNVEQILGWVEERG